MVNASTFDSMSTTAMLRRVHALTGGDLTAALRELDAQALDHPRAAHGARNVLRQRLAKRPGCSYFTLDRVGFVTVHTSAEDAAAATPTQRQLTLEVR